MQTNEPCCFPSMACREVMACNWAAFSSIRPPRKNKKKGNRQTKQQKNYRKPETQYKYLSRESKPYICHNFFTYVIDNGYVKRAFFKKIPNNWQIWSKTFFSNFMHEFKIAILEKLKNCQSGTFEPIDEI